LSEDIIPLVESDYKVLAKPRSRAFAGLSMGGHHALTVALNHHDQFNWIGAFSSAPPPTNSILAALESPAAVNKDLKLLWIACGKKDFLFQRNGEFTALLKDRESVTNTSRRRETTPGRCGGAILLSSRRSCFAETGGDEPCLHIQTTVYAQ